MQYIITPPQRLDYTVALPASKSISNRALIINAIAGNTEMPRNLSDCDDTSVMVRALTDGCREVDVRAAGTSMRFLTAYYAVQPGEEHLLTGTERMLHRPIGILVDALRQLGADITYAGEEGFPPLLVRGRRLSGGSIEVPGTTSSQFISALLLIGPQLQNGLTLHLTDGIISRPYIDLTLCMMREMGADAEWADFETIIVHPQPYRRRTYHIESDWSAASYWYEIMALSGGDDDELRLEGLTDGSRQGDSCVRYLFSLLGVKSSFACTEPGVPTTVTIRRSGHCVSRLDYDFSGSPDLAQTLVVCCALKNIPFHFTGLSTLKVKETDRIEALKTEMRRMGYVLHDVGGCELLWDGERCEPQPDHGTDTYDDHRMALAFAPAAIVCGRQLINSPGVVSKSYPHYWEHLQQCGFSINSVQ